MKFENLLSEIGGYGNFQLLILALLAIPLMVLPAHFLLLNFAAVVPDHRCDIASMDEGGEFENLTQDQRLTISIPAQGDGTLSSCRMFMEPQFHLLYNSSNASEILAVPCQNGWVYDNSTFSSTIITEWDLVCDRKGMSKVTISGFFIGVMVGALAFGFLSDRFGRRNMLLLSYVLTGVCAILSAFSSSYMMFAVLRFFTGVMITGITIITVVLSSEWVDIEHRALVVIIVNMEWSFYTMLFVGVAYVVTDWRWLIIAVSSPLLLAIITWWWIPESARWLIVNGKLEKAQMYLERCARINKRKPVAEIKPEMLTSIAAEERGDKSYSYLDMVKTPKMRKLTLLSGGIWFGTAFIYYGISLNITGLGPNIYLTQFIFALIECPAKVLIYYCMDIFGRRYSLAGMQFLTGFCLAVNLMIPKDLWIFRTVVAVLGKGCSEAAFTVAYLYTVELFPTVIRQNGMGYNSCMARVGVSIMPLILLLEDMWTPLPNIIFCAVSLLTVLIAWALPETRNTHLPETIEDVEQTRKKHLRAHTED
ncbi:hypothetical protein GJAV_G00243320 [Gymnothorax javanicus]|nr:hypothetical protein GJAV_G00243320 [Gymnothorax javanicus]